MVAPLSLNTRQQQFCLEYLIDLNATQAAIRAGYASANAHVTGPRLLANVSIQAEIQRLRLERAERTQISADRVLQELAALAFSDLGQIVDFSTPVPRLRPGGTIPESARRCISAIKIRREATPGDDPPTDVIEFKLWSKTDALEKIAKHLGMFIERHEHTGLDGGPIQVVEVMRPDDASNVQ